jgi:hypothetical protein
MTDICERWRASADALWHRDETAARRAAVEVALGVAHLADASLREILADVVGGADDVRIVDVADADDADDDCAAWVAARDRALERTIARIARIAPTVAVRAVVGR